MLFSAILATLLVSAHAAPTGPAPAAPPAAAMNVTSAQKAPMALGKPAPPPAAGKASNSTASKGSASNASKGAVYMITNDPSGNVVLAANINHDGSLTLASAIGTGGAGQHGLADGPDGLFSQGSVKANANASMLATVNAGSNTISLFAIDPKTPTNLKAVGQPISSGGEFPQSLAFNAAGTMLCALNGGAVDGVQCFSVDAKKGLAPISNSRRSLGLNQTTPATGPAGTASHIIFSEDQQTVFAAIKGNPDANSTGFVAAWEVQKDGSLSEKHSQLALPKGGDLPFALANIPGSGGSLFIADAAIGADIIDLSKGVTESVVAISEQTTVVEVQGQGAVCWSAFSSKTSSFFVTDIKTSLVTEISVDPKTLKSKVIKQYQTIEKSATIDLETATVNGQDFLYVNLASETSIAVFSLAGGQGKAKQMQILDVGKTVKQAGLSISGNNVQGMTVFLSK